MRNRYVQRVLLDSGQGVSNRDIKLENTLLDRLAPGHKPVVKLCGAWGSRLCENPLSFVGYCSW